MAAEVLQKIAKKKCQKYEVNIYFILKKVFLIENMFIPYIKYKKYPTHGFLVLFETVKSRYMYKLLHYITLLLGMKHIKHDTPTPVPLVLSGSC